MRTSNNKLLILIIAFLLVSNLALLFFYFKGKEPGKDRMRGNKSQYMNNFLQKEVGFTSVQLQQFDSLRSQHMEQMKPLMDSLRLSKEALFNNLKTESFLNEDSMALQIGRYQGKIDQKMFHHLRDIRTLCNEEQRIVYDTVIYKVTRRLTTNFRRNNPPAENNPSKN